MKWTSVAALALACLPAAAFCNVVEFGAPAGTLPVEHLRGAAFNAVLPSGRIVTPVGASVVTGVRALGVTLSPDGRYAVVSNAGDAPAGATDPGIGAASSLAVVDAGTMQLVDSVSLPGERYVAGLAAVRDPRDAQRSLVFAAGGANGAVYVFDLDGSGRLTPDPQHVIPTAPAADAAPRLPAPSVPVTLVAAADGGRIYVVDRGGDRVSAIDTAQRTIVGTSSATGFAPFGAALAGTRLIVGNEGLMPYAPVAPMPLVPPFGAPPPDTLRASSLSLLALDPDGDLAAEHVSALPMDPAPDGLRIAGGAHPAAIAVTPDGGFAFVAMSNVDRIATVALAPAPHVAGGTELRLFDRGPYGTQPAALALSKDGSRLYAALAGLDAVAVLDARDPLHVHRLGLLPTGWFPTALALSSDDRTLYVINTGGAGRDRAAGSADPSTLEKIDVAGSALNEVTYTALKDARDVRPAVPHYPRALRTVVVIVAGGQTFDAMLGDLGPPLGDPAGVRFGAAITPNLHALARRFALAGNFYAGADSSLFAIRTPLEPGMSAVPHANELPDAYARAGSIFNNLARHHVSYRDYGTDLELAGCDDGEAADPTVDDPPFAGIDDRLAPTRGLGGRYGANVPAPAVLAGHVDLDYPGWNLRIRDERRAREFIRDYGARVRTHRQPRYARLWLPDDRTGSGPLIPSPAREAADGDRALGLVVQYLSRLPSWKTTAIFVVSADAPDGTDHVDADRTYAVVVSPFARPQFAGMHHLSTASVLKTTEQILHLPALGLDDLLATDMSDFFTAHADPRPFDAIAVGEPKQANQTSRAGDGPGRPEPSAQRRTTNGE